MSKYFTNFFHSLIIASFVLLFSTSFSGCGWKGDPVFVTPEQKIKNEKMREQKRQKKLQREQERQEREQQEEQKQEAMQE